MLISGLDPQQLVLQATALNPDGSPKTEALSSASTRVYHVDQLGVEQEDLVGTPLVRVGTTNVYRYRWSPSALAAGQYFAEYTLVDPYGYRFVGVEDLVVRDFAENVDVEFLRQVASGTWEILGDQMVYYDVHGAELLRFDLWDINGQPTNGINMYKRTPA